MQSPPDLFADYVDSMASAPSRAVFKYLCDYGYRLNGFKFELRNKGYLRTARYTSNGRWPFAFIINRNNFLFYIRKAGRSHPPASLNSIQQIFPSARVNNRGEIQFHVTSEQEATRLMQKLFE